jgi:hypothetical protein
MGMPKTPGLVGWLPDWQKGEKRGAERFFLILKTFAVSAHINGR